MPGNFIITPISGAFDVADVRNWLDARLDAFEDPQFPELRRYVLCGVPSEQALQQCIEGRSPSGAFIYLAVNKIVLGQDEYADVHALRSAMDFVVWLTERCRCRITVDGSDADLTDELNRNGARSLYEDDVQIEPRLWDGKLIRVGFFWEVHDTDLPIGTSLEKARQPEPNAEEANTLRYLESGQLYERVDGSARDYFDDHIDVGPAHLLTDGLYVWPADFAYYVRTYHVHVPRAFVMHAKRNNWQVPEVDVAKLPELAF